MLGRLELRTAGGIAAVAVTFCFVVGIVIVAAAGGPDTVVPETGDGLATWAEDLRDGRSAFDVGAGLIVLGGIIGVVALLAFYDVLRGAGPTMIVAPVLGIFALAFVTLSHALPIVMAEEFAEDFLADREALQPTGDVLAGTALMTNYVGDVLLWLVVVPWFSIAVLQTGALARWIGWLGIFVGVFAGLFGALSIVSSTFEDISSIGFLAFFVWMAAMGVALLRGRAAPEAPDGAPPAQAAPRRARRARPRRGQSAVGP